MKTKRALAAALTGLLLLGAAGCARGGRRGIAVTVVKLDGARIAGELCAVRPNSVVVQEGSGESGYVFVGLPDIRYIERFKVSATRGAASGFLRWGFIGTMAGDVAAFEKPSAEKRRSAILGGLIGGSFGALLGGLKGVETNRIETIDIEGLPREALLERLRKLGRDARIRDEW
jgi:hypothetical protein